MSWRLSDGSTTYTFAIGPDAMNLDLKRSTVFGVMLSNTSKSLVMMNSDQPIIGEISGTLISQAEYNALLGWWQSTKQLTLTDDLGQDFVIIIIDFTPERVLSIEFPFRHKWKIRFNVLEMP